MPSVSLTQVFPVIHAYCESLMSFSIDFNAIMTQKVAMGTMPGLEAKTLAKGAGESARATNDQNIDIS